MNISPHPVRFNQYRFTALSPPSYNELIMPPSALAVPTICPFTTYSDWKLQNQTCPLDKSLYKPQFALIPLMFDLEVHQPNWNHLSVSPHFPLLNPACCRSFVKILLNSLLDQSLQCFIFHVTYSSSSVAKPPSHQAYQPEQSFHGIRLSTTRSNNGLTALFFGHGLPAAFPN